MNLRLVINYSLSNKRDFLFGKKTMSE